MHKGETCTVTLVRTCVFQQY